MNQKTIVIVGGDSALNDAVNCLMMEEKAVRDSIALGVIPNGVMNDFARYWDCYFMQQAQCISAPIQKRHTKLMRLRYSALPEEFSNLTLQVILGVTQRTAEKMIERWHNDGFIARTETGLYKKLFLELT